MVARRELQPINLSVESRPPKSPCPHCGKGLDAVAGGRQVRPGDVSLCCYCAGFCVFTDELRLRLPSQEELDEATKVPEIRLAQAAVREMIKSRGGRV